MYQIEICANSVESCIAAQEGGATRVELCAGIPEGGTTPSIGEIAIARKHLDITLNVIIRPRGGDFVYSPIEISTMIADIEAARNAGADGLVFGALTPAGDIDIDTMQLLMTAAKGLPVTFHRAFDRCRNPFHAIDVIARLGCCRILTSGQEATALDGAENIRNFISSAPANLSFMPGCGVNESNIAHIAKITGAREFHFSARESIKSQAFINTNVAMGNRDADESLRPVTTARRVAATIAALAG